MPLIARHQIAAPVEDFPGTEQTTVAGSDVIDTLSAGFDQSRTLIARQNASNSLSKGKESVGRGEATATAEVDYKGSGTATTAPSWGRLLRSCLLREVDAVTLEFDGTLLTADVRAGDIITNAIAAEAAAVVVEDAPSGQANVKVVMLTATQFSTSEAVFRRRGVDSSGVYVDTSCGTTDASAVLGSAIGKAYMPHSQHEMTFDTTGSWSASDPSEGENIRFTSGGNVVGEALFISASGTTTTCEPLWGTIPSGATIASTSGKTATVAGTPALTQTQGLRLTVRSNRDRLLRPIIGAAGDYSLSGEAGAAMQFAFTFKGKAKTTPDDAAHTTGASFATTTPPRLVGDDGGSYVDGIALPIKSISHALNNVVSLSPNANVSEGDSYALVTDRDPDLTLQVDQLGVGGYDWWAKWRLGHSIQYAAVAGTAAGNTLVFCATNAQIESLADDDSEGVATHSPAMKLREYTADGDNEFVIAHI